MNFHRIDNERSADAGNITSANLVATNLTATNAVIGGTTFPSSVGLPGQVLMTGAGNIASWQTIATSLVVNPVNTDITLDNRQIVNVNAAAGPITVTLPPVSTSNGLYYYVFKTDSSLNAVTIVPTFGDLLEALPANSLSLTMQDERIYLVCNGPRGWFIV